MRLGHLRWCIWKIRPEENSLQPGELQKQIQLLLVRSILIRPFPQLDQVFVAEIGVPRAITGVECDVVGVESVEGVVDLGDSGREGIQGGWEGGLESEGERRAVPKGGSVHVHLPGEGGGGGAGKDRCTGAGEGENGRGYLYGSLAGVDRPRRQGPARGISLECWLIRRTVNRLSSTRVL